MKKKRDKHISSKRNYYDGFIDNNSNTLLIRLAGFLLRRIDFDNESKQTLRNYSEKGHIVYASFHSSNLALLILYNLLKRHNYKLPVYALECSPFILQPIRNVFKRLVYNVTGSFFRKRNKHVLDTDYLENLIHEGKGILLSLLSKRFFIKRYMEVKYDSLIHLINIQKNIDSPIYLFPEMIFWNMNPERTKSIAPKAIKDRGIISGLMTMLMSKTPAFIRISTPINLKEEIENSQTEDSVQRAIIVRNRLLEKFHHEKRTVLGPVIRSHQEMMEKVLYHRDVLDKIERISHKDKISDKKLRKRVYKYYKEIASDFSMVTIKYFSKFNNIIFKRLFNGIYYDIDSIKRIREASKSGPLIIVSSHKSHMDYLIISQIFYQNRLIPPHIAAGVNLSFFPVGTLFRHSGAFFIRRSFKGLKLYQAVFKQYIKALISDGYAIEFFFEGGRTRTGKLLFAQLGFLNILIEAIVEGYNRDLIFVPTSINYDRVIEESSYVYEIQGKEKEKESFVSVFKGRKLLKRKHGGVYLSINEPFSLKELIDKGYKKSELREKIVNEIINKISEVTVVTPFALITTGILISFKKSFLKSELLEKTKILYDYLIYAKACMAKDVHSYSNIKSVIERLIESYIKDGIIVKLDLEENSRNVQDYDLYLLKEDERLRISFYKNSIIHYFLPIAFSSVSLLCLSYNNKGFEESAIKSEYTFIKDLFSREFVYPNRVKDVDRSIQENVYDFFLSKSIVLKNEDKILLNDNKIDELRLYSKIIKEYFESYLNVLLTILNLEKSKVDKNELMFKVKRDGIKRYHLGEFHLPESISVLNYNNAIRKYIDEDIIREDHISNKITELTVLDIQKAQNLISKIKIYLELISI